MKHIFAFVLNLLVVYSIAQENRPHDAYFNEDETYFINPLPFDNGIVATDNFGSNIYWLKDGKAEILFSAPGCGRYMKKNSRGDGILFKYIDDAGQAPAMISISSGKMELLAPMVPVCGQPVEAANGTIAWTSGENLVLSGESMSLTIPLAFEVNWIDISFDGSSVLFNNGNDEIFILTVNTGEIQSLTKAAGFVYPQFSPEANWVSYNSLNGFLYVKNRANGKVFSLGRAGGLQWINEQRFFYNVYNEDGTTEFVVAEIQNGALQTLVIGSVSGDAIGYLSGSQLWFCEGRAVKWINIQTNEPETIHYSSAEKLPVSFRQPNGNKSILKVPGTVPYVHQVYDTPTWHEGWGSCAPTTSVMAFAYYNRLPAWPVTVDHGMSWDPHVNSFGSYVADRYRFNELYYEETADAYGTTAYGGYGYMWTGTYSPNSRMRQYIENHYMTSNQLWTSQCTWANTLTEINAGFVHPICNYLTSSGHLTLTTGYFTTQHTLVFNDPYGNKNNPGYPNYTGYDSYYDWPGYNNGYQNLDASGTHGGVAWTVKAQTNEVVYNDTLIDNNFYGHGFYMNNSTLGSHQRYFRDYNAGYNGHTWWTYSMATESDICWVTWTPTLNRAGKYLVEAFIPSEGADASNARYHVFSDSGDSLVLIDQSAYSDQWATLGVFTFSTGGYVYLGDSTGIDWDMVGFDAMRWTYLPEAVASFTSTGSSVCPGGSVSFSSSSTDADSLLWILPGSDAGSGTLVLETAVYSASGTYDVTLIAYNSNGNDTLFMPGYVEVFDSPISLFQANDSIVQLPSAVVTFVNNSLSSTSYAWNFGDGGTSVDFQPYHIYDSAGIYTVTLIASNPNCPSDTLVRSDYIVVENPSTSGQIDSQSGFHAWSGPEGILIDPGCSNAGNLTLVMVDVTGRVISEQRTVHQEGLVQMPLPVESGVYFISLWSNDEFIGSQRIILNR